MTLYTSSGIKIKKGAVIKGPPIFKTWKQVT